ncbi:MAG TPA: hypothetical protein VF195_11250 [Actinomycetota bacterium]
MQERLRASARRDEMSVNQALDRLPSHPLTGDREVDREIASKEDPSATSAPGDTAHRGRAVLAIAASAAAGILAGLASMKDPVRAARESDEEKSQSRLKGS